MIGRWGRRAAAAVVGCCLAAGCGGPAATWQPAAPLSPAAPSPSPSPSPSPGELTLVFAGDVHFTGRTEQLLRDPATAFGPVKSLLSAADLTLVNLETAVTARGEPEPKQFHFRAPASAYAALRAAGVDAASLANNHALDYGRVGLADTVDSARQADFPVFGAGPDAAAAYAPWLTEVRGTRIAVLGFSQVHKLADAWAARDDRSGIAMAWNVGRAIAAVKAARAQADLVVVFNHWGEEGNECPTSDQKSFARRLASAGADIIVGAHAHVLQGDGWLGKTYVAYGLGNFLWWGTSYSTHTGVLRLTVRGRDVVRNELLPAVVSDTGQPIPLTGAAAQSQDRHFAGLRRCTGLDSR